MKQYFFEDLYIGASESISTHVTKLLVEAFAEVSGDHNLLHVDPEYAATTRFGECIAHGALLSSFISAVLGTRMPGLGTLYISQSVSFLKPVKLGDTVETNVKVAGKDEMKNRVVLKTCCLVKGVLVAEGEAKVYVPSKV